MIASAAKAGKIPATTPVDLWGSDNMIQQPGAIIIAGALIAAALALTNHWTLVQAGDGGTIMLMNRWTGTVLVCEPRIPNLACPP
jgi:hypothetical protein